MGWGRCGLRGLGSSGVGAGEGVGVLVLWSLRGTLGFECLPAWGALAQGGAPVIFLRVGARPSSLGGGLLFLLAYLCWGGGGLRRGWDRRFFLGVSSTYASLCTVTCRERPGEVWYSCLRPLSGGLVIPLFIVPFPLEVDLGPAGGTKVPLSWGSSLVS